MRLRGGLGNQLFQFAAVYSLSRRLGRDFRLGISDFALDCKRTFKLESFQLTKEELRVSTPPAAFRFLPYSGLVVKALEASTSRKMIGNYYFERDFSFDRFLSGLVMHKEDVYLSGYFQSYRYFDEYSEDLSRKFTPSDISVGAQEFSRLLQMQESVFVHVRRGDYISDKAAGSYHGVCPIGYYERALGEIRRRISSPSFYVFSDDMAWAKSNLTFFEPVTFIDSGISVGDMDDFYLMQVCKHGIIANSTFSWWPAWLIGGEDKVIIAPNQWLSGVGVSCDDLIPPDWILI